MSNVSFWPKDSPNKPMEFLVARTSQEIAAAYERLSQSAVIGCDTETSGLNPAKSRLFSVQFSDGELSVLVPLSERIPLGVLAELLENPQITTIFHNAKFDVNFLRQNGYPVENIFCTMVAEKVLTKGAGQSVSLAETLYRYFAVDLDKSQRAKFNQSWDGNWTDELVHYALADVVYLPKLMQEQREWLKRLGLHQDFEIQMQRHF
jgi:ribonuclease D